MKRSRAIAWVLLLAAIASVAAFLALRPREPVYQGKRLSEWLEILLNESGTGPDQARVALRQIGTNALPTLIEMLRTKDSRIKTVLVRLASKQSLVKLNLHSQDNRRFMAVVAFQELGLVGRPALPAVNDLLNQPDTSEYAKDALVTWMTAALDPAGISLLAGSFTNENPQVRANVLVLLSKEVIADAMIQRLRDEAPEVRISAIQSLVRLGAITTAPTIHNENRGIVRALIKSIQDPCSGVRAAAARALGELGIDSNAPVSSLLKQLDEPDEHVDPEAVAATGVQ